MWSSDGPAISVTTSSVSSGGGSSSGTTPTISVSDSTAITTAIASVSSDGTATALITQSQISAAIAAAQGAIQRTGEAADVEIDVSGDSGASAVRITLPRTSSQALVSGEVDSMTLSSSVATMTFDAQALAAIVGVASADVVFTASVVDGNTLSDVARQTVGDHPVYEFSVTSGESTISQFDGTVTVSLPYTPAAGENTNEIVVYYINADGQPELIQDCWYDTAADMLVFTTTHFSTYAVGYNKIAFSDVSDDAWYADAVSFIAAHSITRGTTETTFGPDMTLTRGQFITLIMRAYGIDSDDNFSDAGDTYYTGYLAVAKQPGITSGIGNNRFAPDRAITRQEMFTMLYNTLKVMDRLEDVDSSNTLSKFTDNSSVASYAQSAMAYLVKTGVVSGNDGLLHPTDTTTRAQMAQVLYNLFSK